MLTDILNRIIQDECVLLSQLEHSSTEGINLKSIQDSALKFVRDLDSFTDYIQPYLTASQDDVRLQCSVTRNSANDHSSDNDPLSTEAVGQLICEALIGSDKVKSAVYNDIDCYEKRSNATTPLFQKAGLYLNVADETKDTSVLATRVGIDIGGSLLKLAYVSTSVNPSNLHIIHWLHNAVYDTVRCIENHYKVDVLSQCNLGANIRKLVPRMIHLKDGSVICFRLFPVEPIDDVIDFLLANNLVVKGTVIHATGGGCYKYEHIFKERLPQCIFNKLPEMQCVVDGIKHMHHVNKSINKYNVQKLHTQLITPELTYPYLIVNIGSGVFIVKVTSADTSERVTGTSLGGGTMHGLASTLLDIDSFDEMMKLYDNGTNCLDTFENACMSDETHLYGLTSSFGAFNGDARPEDTARSIGDMVSYNIGILAFLVARLHGVKRILFTGSYTSNHRVTMDAVVAAINSVATSQEEEPLEVLVPIYGTYAGVIGSLLYD